MSHAPDRMDMPGASMTRPRQILCCRSHWPRQATRRLRADSTAVPCHSMKEAASVVKCATVGTSARRGIARAKQILQGVGDPSRQRQRSDLRDRPVDRIRNLMERHLAILPQGIRGVRSTLLRLPEAPWIDHGSSAESLDERKMCVADEDDVSVN